MDPVIDHLNARLDALDASRAQPRFYPVGTPGKAWTAEEKAHWRDTRALPVKRSYGEQVLQKVEALKDRFDVQQYGALSYDPERYPLFSIATRNWQPDLPSVLVTGGVHGYETSGVQGALLFLDTQAEAYSSSFNIIVAPCVSPWGYEVINRWNPNAVDPNRNFVPDSVAEECSNLLKLVASIDAKGGGPIILHVDLHETTDTDETEFRPAKEARDGGSYTPQAPADTIPDGFYTVGDANNPQFDFQKAVIDSVRKVTHIAPPDADGCIIGEPIQQEGVVNYPAKGLGLCMGVTDALYVTTTEIYPDSPLVDDQNCNLGQVASVVGALEYIKGLK